MLGKMKSVTVEPDYKALLSYIEKVIIDNSRRDCAASTKALLEQYKTLAIYLHTKESIKQKGAGSAAKNI